MVFGFGKKNKPESNLEDFSAMNKNELVKLRDDLYPNGNKWMTKDECDQVIKKCNEELEKNPNNESVLRIKIQASIHLGESAKYRGDPMEHNIADRMTANTYRKLTDNFPTKKNLQDAAEFFESCLFSGTEAAAEYYERLSKIEHGNIDYLLKKAAVLQYDPDTRDQAAKCYDEILRLDPNNVKALTEQADTYQMIGKRNEEIQCYEKLLKLNPNDLSILVHTAKTLYMLDRHENALAVCEKILEMSPNPDEMSEAYQAVKIKEMIMQTGKNEEGIPTCPKCKSQDTGYFSFGPPRPYDDDEMEIAKKGRIRMSGCVVMPNTPTMFCNKCGYEWGTMIM